MFNSVTLEVSLKPFKKTDSGSIKSVIYEIFEGWKPIVYNRSEISVMLWVADGSEILDYSGQLDDEFEWCKYVGTANKPLADESTSLDTSLHQKKRLYIENPPKMTYRILKEIVDEFKKIGNELYPNSTITVGETFDIGPEFAVSDFKYNRHNEICCGVNKGFGEAALFINSYGVLKGDERRYAGFPDGIPDKTPFATFLGRQTRIFFEDLGFDYLWLSNGVGFALKPWDSTGIVFDGQDYHTENFEVSKKQIFDFWKNFRKECPKYHVRTRGTNYSAGIDYASDAVCLYDIYKEGFNITPPPNSPWAAIDYDFGLELMGHLSRNAEIPEDDFMFRYYLHDPWWVNSPWYDRYNGEPHDIYLPMSLSRIDKGGATCSASMFSVLSIDSSFGNMPKSCLNEVIPHILKAEKDAPDRPAPFVWVYPFRENTTALEKEKLKSIMAIDWFMCQAINDGIPISTVVSYDNFRNHNKDLYAQSILFASVPQDENDEITEFAKLGGKVVFIGATDNASREFLKLFGLSNGEGISGEHKIQINYPDTHKNGKYPSVLNINDISDGPLTTISQGSSKTLVDGYSVFAEYKNSLWFRGLIGGDYSANKKHISQYDGSEYVKGETLLRGLLKKYGYQIAFTKPNGAEKSSILSISRHNNGLVFSIFSHCTAVDMNLRFPLGAPILDAYEAELKDGFAVYRFPKSEHKECRVFVDQDGGVVGVKEVAPVSCKYRRRILVYGLINATVRFYGEEYCKEAVNIVVNSHQDAWADADKFDAKIIKSKEYGTYYEVKNVTGNVCFSMPYPDKV